MNVISMDNDIDVMICLLPLSKANGGGQLDYIAMQLPWRTCSD
jgi:hypothetical protein